MADRLFLFDDDSNADTGFQFTGQRTVSLEEYGNKFINFYNTALGLPTLQEETGIDVDVDEDITELAEPTARPQDDDDDAPVNILEQNILDPKTGTTSTQYNVNFFGAGDLSGEFDTYSSYLSTTDNLTDRVPLVEGIVEPVMGGNFGDIKFGKPIEQEVEGVKKTVKDLPSRMERLVKGDLTQEDTDTLMKGALSAAAGPFGALASGLIGGRQVRDAFGEIKTRPNGALGLVADMVYSQQYKDVAAIRAATAAGALDTGFAMKIGNMGITRAPDSGTYTGNTQGLGISQLVALEAVSKGYDPRNSAGRNAWNPEKHKTVEQSGGMFVSDNNMAGFYRANGTFYSPSSFTSSAYGLEKHAQQAANKAGISLNQFKSALGVARSTNGGTTLSEAIKDIKAEEQRILNESLRARQAAEAAAREAAAAAERRRIEENKRILAYSQYYYDDGNDDDGGPSLSSSGASGPQESAFDNVSDTEGLDPDDYADDYALGGRVGLAMGGAPGMASGFVDRPPEQVPEGQTVADNRPAQLPEGAFVINAAAVEFAGSKDVRDMLLDAHKEAIRTGLTVDKQGNGAKMIDVAISSGEVVVAPHLAKIIGYDRLEKINNRGKAETRERIQENGQQPVGAAEGGFLTYEGEMPDIGEDVPMEAQVSADTMQQFKAFTKKRRQRGDVERLIDGLDDRSALALAILTETIASKDTLESMEAVGQVIVNRANTNDPDFKDVNTVKEVLKQRSSRGEGSKMFQFDGLEPSSVRDRLKEITSGRAPDALNKVFAAADNVLSRQQPDAESYPTLPDHVLYYTKPGAAGAGFFENNPLLEPFSEIGGHSFYAKHLTKEFP